MTKGYARRNDWTEEQLRYIKKIANGTPRKIIHKKVNERFGLNLSFHQVVGFMKRNGIRNNMDKKFKKGQKSWNKGMKGLNTGGEKGWFKKGATPHNKADIGDEIVTKEGYTRIKVKNEGTYPERFEAKHRLVWQEHHGEIPEGHVVIFADRDVTNFDIDNLLLVRRDQLAVMNNKRLIKDNSELTKTAAILADVILRTNKLERGD